MSLFSKNQSPSASLEKVAAQIGLAISDTIKDGGKWLLANAVEMPQREIQKALKFVLRDVFTDNVLGLGAATLKDGTPVVVSLPGTECASIRRATPGEQVGPVIATKTGWADTIELLGETASLARVRLRSELHNRPGELVELLEARFTYLKDEAAKLQHAVLPKHDQVHHIAGDPNISALLQAGVLVGFAVIAGGSHRVQKEFIPTNEHLLGLWEAGKFAKTLFNA